PAITVTRTTAASAGTLVATSDIPKKNTTTATSGAEVRVSNVTATLPVVADSRLMGVTNPNAVGIDSGISQVNISSGQELVLMPGEGIAMYQETTGDTGVKYTMRVVWSEITSSYNQA